MIYTATARATALSASSEENNPFFAHENAGASATFGGTAALTDGAAANAFAGTTNDYWLPDVTGTTAALQMQFTAAGTYSFAAIAAHNLADLAATVSVQNSSDGVTWADAGAGTVTPADNGPIVWRMVTSGNDATFWRFYITGLLIGDPLYIGTAFLGDDLVMPRRFYQGFSPVLQPTEIALQSNVSEGGNYIGSSVVRRGSTLQADFTYLDPSFVRGTGFAAFMTSFNTGQPFFFGWRPDKYAEDVHYCWRTGGGIRPENTGPRDLMGLQIGARVYEADTVSPDAYVANGMRPAFVADFVNNVFRDNATTVAFDDLFTHTRSGNATMVDSSGLIKWAPHNLLPYSDDLTNWTSTGSAVVTATTVEDDQAGLFSNVFAAVTTVSGIQYALNLTITKDNVSSSTRFAVIRIDQTVNCDLAFDTSTGDYANLGSSFDSVSVVDNGATFDVSLTWTSDATSTNVTLFPAGGSKADVTTVTSSDFSAAAVGTVGITKIHIYRADLGGMAAVPIDARIVGSATYVPTTTTAKYLPRRNHHVYESGAWVDTGVLIENTTRTQLLHTTDALVTQSVTTTAQEYTLHFSGTGTVTLSGASTAGPLVGTGSGAENRVSLTFTPSAGSLTLTVSGTVTNAQLEAGSTPSSYIPNVAGSGTVTRVADDLDVSAATITAAFGGSMPDAISMNLRGRALVNAVSASNVSVPLLWLVDANNQIKFRFDADSGGDLRAVALNTYAGSAVSRASAYILSQAAGGAPYSMAPRVTASELQLSVAGSAVAATSTSLADLTTADIDVGTNYMGSYSRLVIWAVDIGQTGINEVTS